MDKDKLTSETEIRVNRFAAALLMPKDIFTDKYKLFSLLEYKKETIVNELSDIFDVSETAILRRIGELGLRIKSNEKTIQNNCFCMLGDNGGSKL